MRILSALVIVAILTGSAVFIGIAAGNNRANSSFSPEEVWTYQGKELNGTSENWSAYQYIDTNSDNKAEIMVNIENYSGGTFEIEILNGTNGYVLASNVFTDTGYVENGDTVALEPELWGDTILNSTGTPVSEHDWVIFTNHSNNKRVSIYQVDNTTLANKTYRGIDIPSQLSSGIVTGSVKFYESTFHPLSWDGNSYLLYTGYYVAPVYGNYGITEIQWLMMDANLNTVWNKTEKNLGSVSYPTMGTDITSFNGWGLNSVNADILFVNLTASAGNTTLTAIDAETGNVLWNNTIPGVMMISSPLSCFPFPLTSQFDYNHDQRVDFSIPTINTKTNETRAYFIKSDGMVLGYASLGEKKFVMYPIYTDNKTSLGHTLYETVDVNGDGNGDIFIDNNNTELLCWDISNNVSLWSIPLVNQSYEYEIYLSTNDINSDNVWDIYIIGENETSTGKNINVTAIDPKNGNVLWNGTYKNLVGGFPGTITLKELSDINGDGLQDSIAIEGYHNDGTAVYVNVSALSMKDGSAIWTSKVSTGINNEDYKNWSSYALSIGDINGDGTNDVLVEIYYHPAHYWNYIRILSGADGSLLWTGSVENDTESTDIKPFTVITAETDWNQFDYNGDGIENEMLITTGYSVQIYAVTGTVPEFNFGVIAFLIPIAFISARIYRRKH